MPACQRQNVRPARKPCLPLESVAACLRDAQPHWLGLLAQNLLPQGACYARGLRRPTQIAVEPSFQAGELLPSRGKSHTRTTTHLSLEIDSAAAWVSLSGGRDPPKSLSMRLYTLLHILRRSPSQLGRPRQRNTRPLNRYCSTAQRSAGHRHGRNSGMLATGHPYDSTTLRCVACMTKCAAKRLDLAATGTMT
jgi:hypothetical protein